MKKWRSFFKPVDLDDYLRDLAISYESHAFLANATQGIYLRQVLFLTEWFARSGRQPRDIKVLDWGAGKGHISYLLRSAGFNVTSCDVKSVSDDSTFGQETPILDGQGLKVVPLTHPWILPFKDQQFDLVVGFGVLEHVQNDLESLKELRRVLTSGGVFFFSFLPYWLSWTQWFARLRGDWYHPRLYRKKLVRELAHAAGFLVADTWHGQLLPKNSMPHSNRVERVDRFFTTFTPLKFFATNLEGVLVAN